MLRQNQKLINNINIVISGVMIFLSFCLCHWWINYVSPRLAPFNVYLSSIGVFIFVVLVSMFARGVSVARRFIRPLGLMRELFICYIFGALGFGFFSYVFKVQHLSRLYLLSGMVFSFLVVAIYKPSPPRFMCLICFCNYITIIGRLTMPFLIP